MTSAQLHETALPAGEAASARPAPRSSACSPLLGLPALGLGELVAHVYFSESARISTPGARWGRPSRR